MALIGRGGQPGGQTTAAWGSGSYLHSSTCRRANGGTNALRSPVQSYKTFKPQVTLKTDDRWIDFLILFDNVQLATRFRSPSGADMNDGLHNSGTTSVCGAWIQARHFKPILPKSRTLESTDKRGSQLKWSEIAGCWCDADCRTLAVNQFAPHFWHLDSQVFSTVPSHENFSQRQNSLFRTVIGGVNLSAGEMVLSLHRSPCLLCSYHNGEWI